MELLFQAEHLVSQVAFNPVLLSIHGSIWEVLSQTGLFAVALGLVVTLRGRLRGQAGAGRPAGRATAR